MKTRTLAVLGAALALVAVGCGDDDSSSGGGDAPAKLGAGEGALSIAEFIRRASLLPARVVATALGGGVRKGALTVGADADVVTLEPDAFRDRATYEASTRPSTGVRHLLVGGEPVVRDGELVLHARPGRPVRRS